MTISRLVSLLVFLLIVAVTIFELNGDVLTDGENNECMIFESIDELRKTHGDNSNSLFNGLWYQEARIMYHNLLPNKCIKQFEKLDVCERAKKAFVARRIAKEYTRERSHLIVSISAKIWDFFTTFSRVDIWDFLHFLFYDQSHLFHGGDPISFWNSKIKKHIKRHKMKHTQDSNKNKNQNNNQNNRELNIDPEGHMSHSKRLTDEASEALKHDCFIDRNNKNDLNKLWNSKQCAAVCESILQSADRTNKQVDEMLDVAPRGNRQNKDDKDEM